MIKWVQIFQKQIILKNKFKILCFCKVLQVIIENIENNLKLLCNYGIPLWRIY